MKDKPWDMVCFSSIELSESLIQNKTVKTNITLNKLDRKKASFTLIIKYEDGVDKSHLPLLRLAFVMPLLNYGLFSEKFKLDFPLSRSDLKLLEGLNNVFSKDIFVNKILRRRANYILPEYLPREEDVRPDDAKPRAKIEGLEVYDDKIISTGLDKNSCGVLSSGGKESLLTYGLLKEIGCKVYPLYVNESGGHWRTALPGYRYHKKSEPNNQRVWTNVDRFYVFMLDNLKFIRPDHREVWADTYPIRLCIFPYYVFLLLPLFVDKKIGNLLIGNEFDDLRTSPEYLGINHYYGVYDQHQDYDIVMNDWYAKRIHGLVQWSAVRNISGLIAERLLVKRFPELARYQRSCHSCHFEKSEIVPCGKCSKCMGVLLFLLANKSDPRIMNFKKEDVDYFSKLLAPSILRLDQDEKDHSFFLLHGTGKAKKGRYVDHVEKIHLNDKTCDIRLIPEAFRDKIMKIIENYTTGFCRLKDEKWVSIDDKIL